MVKKLITLLFMAVLVFSMSTGAFAQDSMNQDTMKKKAGKEAKWEGNVVRTSADKSTITVRNGSGVEMTVMYDSSTHWVSQFHASKSVNEIDASQVKEGDRVICKGTWESKGVLHATLISKRLSHPA